MSEIDSADEPDEVKCPECDHVGVSEAAIKTHIKMVHRKTKSHMCDQCPAAYASSGGLSTHKKIHTGENNFPCTICGRYYTTKAYLEIHERQHTGNKPYTCEDCGMAFSDPSSFKRHRKRHHENPENKKNPKRVRMSNDVKLFLCEVCNKKFSQLSSLKVHQVTSKHGEHYRQTNEDSFPEAPEEDLEPKTVEGLGSKKFTNEFKLKCIQRAEVIGTNAAARELGVNGSTLSNWRQFAKNPAHCTACDRSFSCHGQLKRHIEARHTADSPDKKKISGGGKFDLEFKQEVARYCEEKSFVEAAKHFKIAESTARSWMKLFANPCVCSLCGRMFPYKSKLRLHLQQGHSDSQEAKDATIDEIQEKASAEQQSFKEYLKTNNMLPTDEEIQLRKAKEEESKEERRLKALAEIEKRLQGEGSLAIDRRRKEHQSKKRNNSPIRKSVKPKSIRRRKKRVKLKKEENHGSDGSDSSPDLDGLTNDPSNPSELVERALNSYELSLKTKKENMDPDQLSKTHNSLKKETDLYFHNEVEIKVETTDCELPTSVLEPKQDENKLGNNRDDDIEIKDDIKMEDDLSHAEDDNSDYIPRTTKPARGSKGRIRRARRKARVTREQLDEVDSAVDNVKDSGVFEELQEPPSDELQEDRHGDQYDDTNFEPIIKDERDSPSSEDESQFALNESRSKEDDIPSAALPSQTGAKGGSSPTDNKKYFCNDCGITFRRGWGLKIHIQRCHEGKRENQCDQCSQSFFAMGDLKRHMMTHHESPTGQQFQCDICSKVFDKECYKKVHERSHINPYRRFKCEECGEAFAESALLTRHLYEHGLPQFQCRFCQMKFRRPELIREHLATEHDQSLFSCEECCEDLKSCDRLRSHLVTAHRPTVFTCEECGKHFAYEKYLRRHSKLHIKGSTKFQCKECKKIYASSSALNSHVSVVHKKEKNFECEVCGKSFGRNSNLRAHMLIHSGVKQFKCVYCPAAYGEKRNLANHVAKHHPGQTMDFRREAVIDVGLPQV